MSLRSSEPGRALAPAAVASWASSPTVSSEPAPAPTTGAQLLVAKHSTLTAKGYPGLVADAGPGNVGKRVSVAEGELSLTNSATSSTTTLGARAGSVELDVGTNNVDGSQGAHIKLGAAVVSAELTVKGQAEQVSVGADQGVGVEASSGTRDIDGDGNREYCFRGGAAVVLGACIEPGQLMTDLQTAWQTVKHLATSASYAGGRW